MNMLSPALCLALSAALLPEPKKVAAWPAPRRLLDPATSCVWSRASCL